MIYKIYEIKNYIIFGALCPNACRCNKTAEDEEVMYSESVITFGIQSKITEG